MEMKVISGETIKPSIPTPPHLRTFKVSFFDKLIPPVYPSFVSFYRRNDGVNPESFIDQLKHSLSATLTRYYPFAGRVSDDDLTIDCNDMGVIFLTARVNCTLFELLAEPEPKTELFYRLGAAVSPTESPADKPPQLAIQLNLFDCGGVALSISFFHRIIDATTIAGFLKCWAAIADGKEAMHPDYSAPSIFPQGEESLPASLSRMIGRLFKTEGKGVIKRFVFNREAISGLKNKATSQLVPNPTRVEAIVAFIWKHCMRAAATISGGSRQPSMVSHGVNLRSRIVPPLPEYSVGNIVWNSFAFYCDDGEEEIPVDGMVGLVRKAVEKVKEEFVANLQGEEGVFGAICESFEEVREKCSDPKYDNMNPYLFSSWCYLGLNEVDFGWGKPIWCSQMGSDYVYSIYKNIVALMDGETGDKIEAWITLDHREMAILEGDSEFIAFASSNPPIVI